LPIDPVIILPEPEDWTDVDENVEAAGRKNKTVKYTVDLLKEQIKKFKANGVAEITKNKSKKNINDFLKYQHVSVKLYFQYLLDSYEEKGVWAKMTVSQLISSGSFYNSHQSIFSYKARCIRSWADYYIEHGTFKEFQQGQHYKTFTTFTNEGVQERLRNEIRLMKSVLRTPLNFCQNLNNTILRDIIDAPTKVCERTALRWMKFLGFFPKQHTKGYFGLTI
jgi:hypothetical protein